MAAKFPGEIQFSERLPSGQAPSVTGQPDVRTGAQMYGAAIQQLGGVFQQMSKAWEQTELSTMRRQFDETSFAAFNAYSAAGDAKGREDIVKQWSSDIGDIKSASGSVNKKFQLHLNRVQPSWAQNFAGQEVKLQKQNIADSNNINLTNSYLNGDVGSVNEAIQRKADFGQISQAEADRLKAEAPNEILVLQATRLAETGQFKEIESLQSQLLKPTTDQLRRMNLSAAKAERNFNKANAEFKEEATTSTLNEWATGELKESDLIARHAAGFISDSEFKFILNDLRRTDTRKTDPIANASALEIITKVGQGVLTKQEAKTQMYQLMPNLDETAAIARLGDIETVFGKAQNTRLNTDYSLGDDLIISKRFKGIPSIEDMMGFSLLSPGEQNDEQRKFTAEIQNNALYKAALNEWFQGESKKGIVSIDDIRNEAIKFRNVYRERSRMEIDEFERTVVIEQERLTEEFVGPPEPVRKPVSEMTPEERAREIRELQRKLRK